MVSSFVDGRVRLRHADLKKPSIVEKITKDFARRKGIDLISANRKVGSLLVHYDRTLTRLDEILPVLRKHLKETPAPGKNRPVRKRSRNNSWPQLSMSKRQLINLGLLASLAGSLLALFVNATTAHIQLGLLFTAVSVLHLFDKKKTLLV